MDKINNKYFLVVCVWSITGITVGTGELLGTWHISSSDPSTQCLTPSHLLSLLTQAPYLHRKVYFWHLKFKNLVKYDSYFIEITLLNIFT
jgi:hypothetical protein